MPTRIIVVSNRLPVTIHPELQPPDNVKVSSGGLASALRSVIDEYEELVWIGWPGCCVSSQAEQERLSADMAKESSAFQLIPVWLSQADVDDFYNGFSNSSLWPLLHWMTPYARFKRAWSEAYRRVNEKFCDAIIAVATPDDLIWIHDYHLFFVPQMLRKKRDNAIMQAQLEEFGFVPRPKDLPEPVEAVDSPVEHSNHVKRPSGLPKVPEMDDQTEHSTHYHEALGSPMVHELSMLSMDDLAESSTDEPHDSRAHGREVQFHPDAQPVIRRRLTDVEIQHKLKIAFFLHTPFPSYEVICVLPQCVDIIEGILGADLVGFHTYNYLRHFRSCVIRLCGVTPDFDHVDHRGQRTKLGVYPIGANVQGIMQAMKTEKFAEHLKEYTEEFQGKSLVLSVERLDYSKGMPQKLVAIKTYLEEARKAKLEAERDNGHGEGSTESKHARLEDLQKRFETRKANRGLATSNLRRVGNSIQRMWSRAFGEDVNQNAVVDHTRTVFVFIAVPSRQEVEEYKNIEEEVHRSISDINGTFSTLTHQPIVYIHRSVPLDELAALYARADICLVTPLIDGMNLVAKEFIVTKDPEIENVVPGTVVLSELAGAAQELFDAIVVNPYDEDAVADAIAVGLELTRGGSLDKELRWQVTERMRQSVIQNDAVAWARALLSDLQGPRGSAIARPEHFSMQILPDSVAAVFSESRDGLKALFLDYDGTLREFEPRPEDAIVSQEDHELYQMLSERSDLKVFIVSGRNKEFLYEQFGMYPTFTLIAEHGFVKLGPDTRHKWQSFNMFTDTAWMEKVHTVMELYSRCTPGSRIEQKTSAIVWHYRECDEAYGQFKAKELTHQLALSLTNMPCHISQGSKIVEVASLSVKKGLVVRIAIQQQEASGTPFSEVIIIGDDRTDESMFVDAPEGAWTVKVGPGDTAARHRLKAPGDVRRFLRLIAEKRSSLDSQVSPSSPNSRFYSCDRARTRKRADFNTGHSEETEGDDDVDPLEGLPHHETEEPRQVK